MPLLVKDFQTPYTADELREFLLERLEAVGFPVQAWQEEGAARAFLEMSAALGAQLSQTIADLGNQTYLDDASGKFLSKKTESDFDEPRLAAQRAVFPVNMVNSGVVAYPVAARAVILRSKDGVEFTNQSAVTVTSSSTTVVTFEAVNAGSNGNIPAQNLTLVTPLAGVVAEYLGIATNAGSDDEADKNLKLRAKSKWGTLRVEKVKAGVENLVRNAAPAVYSVGIDDQNPRGAGTVDVYLAGKNATAGVDDVADAQAALDLAFFNNGDEDKRVLALASPTLPMNLNVTVYYTGVDPAELRAQLQVIWTEFLSNVPIGGFDLRPGPNNALFASQIVDEFSDSPGVVAVSVTTPATFTNVPVNTKLIQGAVSFKFIGVNNVG